MDTSGTRALRIDGISAHSPVEEGVKAPEAGAPSAEAPRRGNLGVQAPDGDPVRQFMREALKHPLMSGEEEIELAKTIEARRNELLDLLYGLPVLEMKVKEWLAAIAAGELLLRDVADLAAMAIDAKGDEFAGGGDEAGGVSSFPTELEKEMAPRVLEGFTALAEGGMPARESLAGIILQPPLIREISETIRAASRRLVELEGRLLRLARQAGVARDELASELQRCTLTIAWLRRKARAAKPWERLLHANDGEAARLVEEIRATIAPAAATILRFREKASQLSKAEKSLERAKNEMTVRNLRLVVWVARAYAGRGVPMADLIQEGNIGLMRAVEKFDYRRGHKFGTYATWWVRQGISRSLVDGRRTIRVPVHLAEAANQLTRERHRLKRVLERDPTEAELGEALNIPVDKVKLIVSSMREIARLDAPVGEDGDATLGDFLVDDTASPMDFAIETGLRSATEAALAELLTAREAEVVRRRFGIGRPGDETLEEIGKDFQVTRERIRQIESKALKKLAQSKNSRSLRSFLEG